MLFQRWTRPSFPHVHVMATLLLPQKPTFILSKASAQILATVVNGNMPLLFTTTLCSSGCEEDKQPSGRPRGAPI